MKKIKEWWYYNMGSYEKELDILLYIVDKRRGTLDFVDAIELQKFFPRIISDVTLEHGVVTYRLNFWEHNRKSIEQIFIPSKSWWT
jgi:hypothetical protein